MRRCLLAPLAAVLLVALGAPPLGAAERCATSCRASVAACRRSECGSARGAARRECIEQCNGRLGCPARIRTLAYVVTRCRGGNGRIRGSQALWIRRGDCDPVRVMPVESPGEVDDSANLCQTVAANRAGFGSVLAGVFQRLGVTPDGSGVVFEVTNQFQLIGHTPLEKQGFFYVRADGSGLRWLAPPSGDRAFRVVFEPNGQPVGIFQTYLPFSPSGRLVAYTDVVAGPDRCKVTQIFTLDVTSGRRTR